VARFDRVKLGQADRDGAGAPNAYPTYDLLGRQMFLSATAKF
jgi:hypothetical protein